MEEQTTTESVEQEPAAESPQLNDSQVTDAPQDEAVETTEPTQTTDDSQDTNQEPSTDDTSKWLESKGIDPSTQEGQAALIKQNRELEKQFHESRQQKETPTQPAPEVAQMADQMLQNRMGDILNQYKNDPVMQRLESMEAQNARLEIDRAEARFYQANQGATDNKAEINQFIMQDPIAQQLIAAGETERALTDAFMRVQVQNMSANTEAAKTEAKKEVLTNLQTKQRTTSVKGNATTNETSNKVTAANADDWYAALTPQERRNPANQEKYNQALAG